MPAVRPVGSARRRSRCPSRPVRSSWGSQRVRDTMPVRGRARPPARRAVRPGGSSGRRTRPATPDDRRPAARRPRRGRSGPHRASVGGTSSARSRSPTGVPRWSPTNGRPWERTTGRRGSSQDPAGTDRRDPRPESRRAVRGPRRSSTGHRSMAGGRSVGDIIPRHRTHPRRSTPLEPVERTYPAGARTRSNTAPVACACTYLSTTSIRTSFADHCSGRYRPRTVLAATSPM